VTVRGSHAYYFTSSEARTPSTSAIFFRVSGWARPRCSTTSSREDLDQALFGVTVSERDVHGDEVRQYFQPDGIFAGGSGDPTISGVLGFT
jgi:hypothetical protein